MTAHRFSAVGQIRVGMIFLGRTRPGFDPQWGEEIRKGVREATVGEKLDVVFAGDNVATPAALGQSIRQCQTEGVEVLVVVQPTMSDGRLAPLLARDWHGPLIVWATPERQTGETISANSLVGSHIFASILGQFGRSFLFLYGHPTEPEVRADLVSRIMVANAAGSVGRATVGLIGSHAPGFINLAVDPGTLHNRLGCELYHEGVQYLLDAISQLDARDVADDVAVVQGMRLPLREITVDDLETASRVYLALRNHIETNGLNTLAVKCWPELPNVIGQWPYLALSRLATEGYAVAQEGDVDGTIGMLIANELGVGPCYVSDWLEHDSDKAAIWHTGTIPLQLCAPQGSDGAPAIARHFNNGKPAVIESAIASDLPVTVFRLWSRGGEYHMTAFEGRTIAPSRKRLGLNGVVQIEGFDLKAWFESMVYQGLPHHVNVVKGHVTTSLRQVARLLQVTWHDWDGR